MLTTSLIILAALGATLLISAVGLVQWTRVLTRRAEADYPPVGRIVAASTDGAGMDAAGMNAAGIMPASRDALHVLERGAGPPVVFLHGAYGGLQDFAATVLDAAAQRYRCIAVDRPGHGYSPPPEGGAASPDQQARALHNVLASMGVERAVLVGFSWGASVALAHGLLHPRHSAGLVLINGVYFPWPAGAGWPYEVLTQPLLGPVLAHTLALPLGRHLAALSVRRAFHPALVASGFAASPLSLALRPRQFLIGAQEIQRLSAWMGALAPRYGTLRAPAVIVAGGDDIIVNPRTQSRRLHGLLPRAELTWLPGVGHHVLYTQPQAVLRAVDRAWDLAQELGRDALD